MDGAGDSTRAKVLGAFDYGLDVVGRTASRYRLHAVRADRAPSRVRGFHVSDAAVAAGAVLVTSADIGGDPCIGPARPDEPALPAGLALYPGQVLALLAVPVAGDRAPGTGGTVAGPSAADVTVEYEALAAGETVPHDPGPMSYSRGDVDAQFERAAYVADGTYLFPSQRHFHLDVDAGRAEYDGHTLHVTAPTQAPYELRATLASVTGLPESAIEIDPVHLGGAFGSRLENLFPCQLAVAAIALRSSVSWVVSPRERVRFGVRGHALAMRLQTAVGSSGDILATTADFALDQGAFTSYSPVVLRRLIMHLGTTYRTEAVRAHGHLVQSFLPPTAAFRGFGVPQLAVAVEHQIDALADKLGVDPIEFRIEHALDPLVAPIRRCAELLRSETGTNDDAIGIAPFAFGIGNTARSNPASVTITHLGDGAFELHAAVIDYGQGAHRALHRMTVEAIASPRAVVRLRTELGEPEGNAGKTSASRTVHFVGAAIDDAVANLRALAGAGPGDDLVEALCRAGAAAPLSAAGHYDPHESLGAEPYPIFSYGCYGATVDRDTATGGVTVRRMVCVHDVGPVVDLDVAVGQVHGGTAMGAGYVLFEAPDPTAELAARLPVASAADLPRPVVEFVHDPSAGAPRAGLGEPAGLGASAALHSAMWRTGRNLPPGRTPYAGDTFVQEFELHTSPPPARPDLEAALVARLRSLFDDDGGSSGGPGTSR